MPVLIEHDVEWQAPWSQVQDETVRASLLAELVREVAPGHVLHGRPASILARRCDCDDVLALVGRPEQLAVVHLTYCSGPDRPPWPSTRIFESFSEFAEKVMSLDHDEYESEK